MKNKLSAKEIAALSGVKEENITIFEEIGSTNTYLSALAREGEAAGRVVLAEAQSAGRGRMGRRFFSPAGSGIYMSLLLRPKTADAGRMTTLAAVVVADAIERVCGVKVGIKWVNDLIFDEKKLCGILAEGSVGEFMVIGIGLNVKTSAFPPELADIATSLEDILGFAPDRNRLVAEILRGFANAELETAAHMGAYRRRSLTLGRSVTLLSTGEIVFVNAIEDDGALLVSDAENHTRRILSGEVSVRPVN